MVVIGKSSFENRGRSGGIFSDSVGESAVDAKSGDVGDGINEMNEAVEAVYPIFEIVLFGFVDRRVTRLSWSSR